MARIKEHFICIGALGLVFGESETPKTPIRGMPIVCLQICLTAQQEIGEWLMEMAGNMSQIYMRSLVIVHRYVDAYKCSNVLLHNQIQTNSGTVNLLHPQSQRIFLVEISILRLEQMHGRIQQLDMFGHSIRHFLDGCVSVVTIIIIGVHLLLILLLLSMDGEACQEDRVLSLIIRFLLHRLR